MLYLIFLQFIGRTLFKKIKNTPSNIVLVYLLVGQQYQKYVLIYYQRIVIWFLNVPARGSFVFGNCFCFFLLLYIFVLWIGMLYSSMTFKNFAYRIWKKAENDKRCNKKKKHWKYLSRSMLRIPLRRRVFSSVRAASAPPTAAATVPRGNGRGPGNIFSPLKS